MHVHYAPLPPFGLELGVVLKKINMHMCSMLPSFGLEMIVSTGSTPKKGK